MNLSFIGEFMKILVLLPFVLILIYITFKYGGKYMGKLNNGRIIKVHERVALGQNTFISIVTIGEKPYLISNGEKGAQILLELDDELLETYQRDKSNLSDMNLKNVNLTSYLERIRGKMKNEKMQ